MLAWLAVGAVAQTLGDPHDLDDAVTIEQRLATWTLEDGTIYPIHDVENNVMGFVFQGESTLELRPGTRAPFLANRMVLELDTPKQDARQVGEGLLTTPVDGAVVLGRGAFESMQDAVLALELRDGVWMLESDDGETEVLVQGRRRRPRDRRQAERWLDDRMDWMRKSGIDPAGLLVADQWEVEAGTGAAPRWFASLRTDLDWGLIAGDTLLPRVPQRWLEIWRDDRGVLSDQYAEAAWAHGQIGDLWLAAAAPRPDHQPRLDVTSAGVLAYLRPEPGGMAAELGVTADIVVTAVGGPVVHAVIDVPHTEQLKWGSNPPLPNGFELHSVQTPDGDPLPWAWVPIGGQFEGQGSIRTIAVRLPDVLQPEERTTLRVSFSDRHRLAHLMEYGGYQTRIFGFGTTTGLIRVLPEVRGHEGGAVPVSLQAGIARMGRTHVVASHDPGERWANDEGRWVRANGTTRGLAIGAGRWFHDTVPARRGLPSLGLHPLTGISEFDRVGEIVLDEIERFESVLPPFPHDHLSIVESFRSPGRPYVASAAGLSGVGEAQFEREVISRLEGLRLSQLVLDQWWFGRDIDEPEVAWTLTWALAIRGLEGGPRKDRDMKEAWIAARDMAPEVYAMGPVLEAEAGPDALFRVAHALLSEDYPISWDGLREALQDHTELAHPEGFLTTWVQTGTAPRVEVAWQQDGAMLQGEVTTDLPYGAFTLPVTVGEVDIEVAVVDGVGAFEVAVSSDKTPRVRADRDNTLPLRRITVRQAR